jgi:hypothetical protein
MTNFRVFSKIGKRENLEESVNVKEVKNSNNKNQLPNNGENDSQLLII